MGGDRYDMSADLRRRFHVWYEAEQRSQDRATVTLSVALAATGILMALWAVASW